MPVLRVDAPAKLNLFLHVTGKRKNYHELESLAVFTQFGDTVTLEPSPGITMAIEGPFAEGLPRGSDNLAVKAATLLQSATGCRHGAHIIVEKQIPVGAGLGGGSADAAAVLRGLVQMWNLDIDAAGLGKLAMQLGSDVPVCLASTPAWLCGIGDDVTPVGLNAQAWLLLINPGVPVSTADVFQHFASAWDAPVELPNNFASLGQLLEFLHQRHNALTAPALTIAPVIAEVLAALEKNKDCLLARMSGSGATCFGLYADKIAAESAMKHVRGHHADWWCMATGLYGQAQ